MAISSVQSGYSLMQQSQSLSNQAARDIADRTGNDNRFGQDNEDKMANKRAEEEKTAQRNDPNANTANNARDNQGMGFNRVDDSTEESEAKEAAAPKEVTQSHVDSLLQLNQAKTYNQVGANVVQRSNEIVGTMLDTHV